ncbi:MAG: sigma 54-interacting transcriptional regulator [Polyangiaceae bacterium]
MTISDAGGEAEAFRSLAVLSARLAESVSQPSFLESCLETLVDALRADRAVVLFSAGERAWHVAHGRKKERPLEPSEREEISKSVATRVKETGAAVVWRPLEDADATASMVFLGIHLAVAAPLRALSWSAREGAPRSELRGVLYLDFRDRKRKLGDAERALIDAAANLIGAVLEPVARLEGLREDLRLAQAATASDRPSLDDLLRYPSMAPIREELATCLRGELPILVLGESGTGKTYFARAIAEASGRRPIVRAVLGSSDDLNTITSELFGHEKGSFSGALQKRTGLVEFADQGTLIFDEILNLPKQAQQLLLDFTQFGEYRPLGHERRESKRASVRIIAATNGDLPAAIREGRFREDLYYRLAAVTLELPPLRARRDEIPTLAESILRRIDLRPWRIAIPLRKRLVDRGLVWAGNVRQLESVLRRARERALAKDPDGAELASEHVTDRDLGAERLEEPRARSAQREAPTDGAARRDGARESAPLRAKSGDDASDWSALQAQRAEIDRGERELLESALARHDGIVAHVARELGVGRTSLLSRLDTLGVARPKSPKARS